MIRADVVREGMRPSDAILWQCEMTERERQRPARMFIRDSTGRQLDLGSDVRGINLAPVSRETATRSEEERLQEREWAQRMTGLQDFTLELTGTLEGPYYVSRETRDEGWAEAFEASDISRAAKPVEREKAADGPNIFDNQKHRPSWGDMGYSSYYIRTHGNGR
jgi:hypothetical protein